MGEIEEDTYLPFLTNGTAARYKRLVLQQLPGYFLGKPRETYSPFWRPRAEMEIDARNTIFTHAMNGNIRGVCYWLDNSFPLEMQYPGLGTLMHVACYHGHVDLVRELFRRGADITALRTRDYLTPYELADAEGYAEIVGFLMHVTVRAARA